MEDPILSSSGDRVADVRASKSTSTATTTTRSGHRRKIIHTLYSIWHDDDKATDGDTTPTNNNHEKDNGRDTENK
jgi:hypothetical protein